MKKIYLIVTGIFLLTGCDHSVKDIFDQDATARNNAVIAHIENLLTGAANGWFMEYYPHKDQLFGGYNMVMKFDEEGNVDVWSELADDVSVPVRSHYTVDSSNGPSVIFDTYNEYFHYFSSPATLWGDGVGTGFGGDYILIYVSGDESRIEFKGKKSKSRIVMRPVPASFDRTAYLSSIASVGDFVSESTRAEFVKGGDAVDLHISGMYPVFTRSAGAITYPFRFTENGLEFYEPVTVFGTEIKTLVLDRVAGTLTDPVSGLSAELIGRRAEFDDFSGSWRLYYKTTSDGSSFYYKTVTLVPDPENKYYTMTGLEYDVVFEFRKRGGILSYNGQNVGMQGDRYVVSTAVAQEGKHYSYWFERGLRSNWNGTSNIINFEDNGMWSSTLWATGFNFRLYDTKVPHAESNPDILIQNYYHIYLQK